MTWSDVLLVAALVGEGLVAFGIYLESPKEKDCRQKAAFVCVFGGVLISAVATILLFVQDDSVMSSQSSQIVALETERINDEHVMSAQSGKIIALETELTPRRLTAAQEENLRQALMQYAGSPFSLAAAPAEEPFAFGQQLRAVLVSANWHPFPYPIGDINVGGTGLWFGHPGIILAISTQEPGLLPIRAALANALSAEGFKPFLMRFSDVPALPEGGVMVIVGAKPLAAFIEDKATSAAKTSN